MCWNKDAMRTTGAAAQRKGDERTQAQETPFTREGDIFGHQKKSRIWRPIAPMRAFFMAKDSHAPYRPIMRAQS